MAGGAVCSQTRLLGTVFAVGIGLLCTVTAQNPSCTCLNDCGTTGITSSDGRKVNVAYGKSATMSSTWSNPQGNSSGPACVAANGRTDTTFVTQDGSGHANCIHTAGSDTKAWWKVDLGQNYTVVSVTVFARLITLRRMALTDVDVDRATCYSFPDNINNNDIQTTTAVSCGLTGRYVWLKKRETNNDDRRYLNVCEVQVWACADDYYGDDCTNTCGNCRGDDVCDKVNGHCPGDCQLGFQFSDPLCKQPCDDGKYGDNCVNTCGNCRGNAVCNKVDGTCSGGCQPGYKLSDPLCKQPCDDGYYGDCTQTCGNCRGNAVCNKADGTCSGGCQPGFEPSLCKQPCDDGFYGDNCANTCGNCRGNAVCNKTDGTCPGGCQPWFNPSDPLCKQPCPPGTYDENCNPCGNCRGNDACNNVDGRCPDGCQPGFDPSTPTCTQQCPQWTYGDNCTNTCGNCRGDHEVCNNVDGTCLRGCLPGYDPSDPLCKRSADTSTGDDNSQSLIGPVVGAVLGGFALLAIAVVAAAFIRRSRRQKSTGDTEPAVAVVDNIATAREPSPDEGQAAVDSPADDIYEPVDEEHTYDKVDMTEGGHGNTAYTQPAFSKSPAGKEDLKHKPSSSDHPSYYNTSSL